MNHNKDKIILHLCADIGSDTFPYKENGYDVRLVGSDIGVERHHPDYSKPLDIIQVCKEHHKQIHAGKIRV